MGLIKRLQHGIVYAPLTALKEALVALGVLLALCQGFAFFVPGINESATGWVPLVVCICASAIYGRWKTWKIGKIVFNVPHTNTKIEIAFGDLFNQDGLRVIPVNEFFDSEIGKPVSDRTLHGILIEKHLEGQTFEDVIGNQLDGIEPRDVVEKIEGKTKSYPIGTTITINTDGKYLAFALSKTQPDTCKAYCDVADMWTALGGLWKKGRVESGGSPINVPLVGSGQSGVGLPARDLLNLILLSAITETKKNQITGKIRVILRDEVFEELDLRKIRQHWTKQL